MIDWQLCRCGIRLRNIPPPVIVRVWVCLVKKQKTLLLPGAHVCVNSHAVISSIAEFLLANLCTAEQREEREMKDTLGN